MSDKADVIVVGGGVQGAAVALHLLEAGVEDVRLLERDDPFEATSSAGAGFIAIWAALTARPYGPEEVAVERYGIGFYRDLQEQGHDVGFAQNGLLLVAASDEASEQFQAIRRAEFDADTITVDARRIEELTSGAIRADQLRDGVFQPTAGQVFTPKVGRALTKRVLALGGTIEARRPATALQVQRGRITGVQTATGSLSSDTVILAAGAWTNELLRPVGTFAPYVPQITSRVITEPLGLPSSMPAIMLAGVSPDGPRLWIRQHEGGLLWGGVDLSHPRDVLVGVDHLPTRLDETPLDSILACERLARRAAPVMPALGRFTSMTVKHGAPCFTPDQRALVGPVPGIDGLYAMAGDNEAGVTHGPGFAKLLAENVAHGASALADIDTWRLDRFDDRYPTEAAVAAAVKHTSGGAQ